MASFNYQKWCSRRWREAGKPGNYQDFLRRNCPPSTTKARKRREARERNMCPPGYEKHCMPISIPDPRPTPRVDTFSIRRSLRPLPDFRPTPPVRYNPLPRRPDRFVDSPLPLPPPYATGRPQRPPLVEERYRISKTDGLATFVDGYTRFKSTRLHRRNKKYKYRR